MYKYVRVDENDIIIGCQESSNPIIDDSLIEINDDMYSFEIVGDKWDKETKTIKKLVKKTRGIEMEVNKISIEEVNEKVEVLTSKIDEIIRLIGEKG